jgi:sec-independent protein translocase protein TatA
MGALSPAHLILILVVALLVIGPGKLPETGAALGRAIRDFRQAVDGTVNAAATTADGTTTDESSKTVSV